MLVFEGKYEDLFNSKPSVVACHAGLECGILGTNYPDMDMISFGPTIKNPHSPDEKVNIKLEKQTFLLASVVLDFFFFLSGQFKI